MNFLKIERAGWSILKSGVEMFLVFGELVGHLVWKWKWENKLLDYQVNWLSHLKINKNDGLYRFTHGLTC